jgi:hypothetical protein
MYTHSIREKHPQATKGSTIRRVSIELFFCTLAGSTLRSMDMESTEESTWTTSSLFGWHTPLALRILEKFTVLYDRDLLTENLR